MMTGRKLTPEHMDDPAAGAAEIDEALRFIRMVNRRMDGTAAALVHFKQWAVEWPRDRAIRIIDIGTGSADIPVAIADWAKAAGHRVHITAVDLHPVTLELARQHVGDRPEIEIVQGDALKLTEQFASGSFEYAHAGMFLHHLPDIEVMTVLRIMDRLTTRGLIWNDLLRNTIGRVAVRLLTLRAPPLVRHDAVVSVAAGFTKREAIDLARRAGLTGIQVRVHLWHRFTLACRKS